MPCCFKNWKTEEQQERRLQCSRETTEIVKPSHSKKSAEDYIIGPEKFPIPQNRWGYLPLTVQVFLQEMNADCQVSQSNTNIRPHHTCLLRHGVEHNNKQSFLACIADALFYTKSTVPSIAKLRELLVASLDIDLFLTLQNGNIVGEFGKEGSYEKEPSSKNIDTYKTSQLYKRVHNENKKSKKNTNDDIFLHHVIDAYEKFIEYLQNDTNEINYTYIWDLLCRPHPKLFPSGINLVILQVSSLDTTNNIEIICPVNQYSTEIYDPRKETLLLLHMEKADGDYFEPIYAYRDEETTKVITKTFGEYDPRLSKQMKNVFRKLIKPLLYNTCVPLSSKPNEYKSQRPLLLSRLVEETTKIDYSIVSQIMNYQGKIISLVVKNAKGNQGVVTCYPSAALENIPIVLMSDETMYHPFDETVSFLQTLSTDSKKVIPCLPAFKVTEDELIVGILTETNQFIQVDPPVPVSETNDDIKTLDSENYLMADAQTAFPGEKDTERVEYIHKIKLETNFYNVFRNTVRIFVNKNVNSRWKEQLETEIKNEYILYNVKVMNIVDILKKMLREWILFSEDIDFLLMKEEDIATCITYEQDKCNKKKPLCAFTTGNTCQILLPKKNLVTGKDNDVYYYVKMADELLRFKRINTFLFEPQTFLSFGSKQYQIREDEVILLQSILLQSYFDDLKPDEVVRYNTFDTAQPKSTQRFENRVTTKDLLKDTGKREYEPKKEMRIVSEKWNRCFPSSGMMELVYEKSPVSGWTMMMDITQKTLDVLRKDLLEEYVKFMVNYEDNIMSMWIEQGKKSFVDSIKEREITMESILSSSSDHYYLTNVDIWLLVSKYQIPCMFLSSQTFVETKYERTEMIAYGERTDSFVYILCPRLQAGRIPVYKWVQRKEETRFPLSIFVKEDCIGSLAEAIDKRMDVYNYIKQFTVTKKTAPRRKKLTLVDDEEVVV